MRLTLNAKPTGLTSDSRTVKPGDLFLAYPGEHADGRKFIADAIAKGAEAVLWDPQAFEWSADWAVENAAVHKLKQQAGLIADQFYGKPSSKLQMIGVTGTNGKTSVSQWIAQCLNYVGNKTAVIGTLGNGLPGALAATNNTTPDALVLHQLLKQYQDDGAQTVSMEVSSHGINQGRVSGVHFDVAVLTNLSRDHLDYHGSYEQYAKVKTRLFTTKGLRTAVLNIDDAFGQQLVQTVKDSGVELLTYGIDKGDIRATKIQLEQDRLSFFVNTPDGQADVTARLVGRFNVYNLLAVLATLLASGVALMDAVGAIANITPIPGRMQQFGGKQLPLVVVDYAHTPDSLEHVLKALRQQTSKRLICVFGCGGNRDQGKRAVMGEIASRLADGVVVTNDNPRDENPDAIIQAILEGVSGEYAVEEDRAKAIEVAVNNAHAGDIVLVAGKGHEDYQEVAGKKTYFSDVEQVEKVLKHYEVAIA